ncbi:MAG: alpha/beta hydrolase [Leadbetterella sp.]|nr:alpha/beta hydrolase [Leadbetterella sp.]
MKIILKLTTALLLNTCSGALYSQNAESYKEEALGFVSNGNRVSGKLITPLEQSEKKLPVVVFVHGSGPEDYSSSGDYRYLFEQFTKIGFACYSWDRQGVANSEGKWYEQGVKERASEVADAVKMLKTVKETDPEKTGFWGISQAGWVMPEAAGMVNPAFVIAVSSPATTAIEQELYRIKASMRADGFSRKAIKAAMAYTREVNILVDADSSYAAFAGLQNKIKDQSWVDYVITGDEVVYRYLGIVFKEDESPAFKNLNFPVLAVWGENDLVVPPKKSARVFRNRMRNIGNRNVSIKIIPDADHTLTFNLSGKSAATIERRKQYKDNPAAVFAPGYVPLMVGWLQGLF